MQKFRYSKAMREQSHFCTPSAQTNSIQKNTQTKSLHIIGFTEEITGKEGSV